MKKTLIRILTGVFLIGLLVLCLHLGDIVFLLIFGGVYLITIKEMDALIKAMGKEIVITPAYIFAGFFGIVYYLTSYNLSVVFAFGLLMVAATMVGQVLLIQDDFSAAAYCLLPFVYPILSECVLVAIYFALPPWMAKTACCAAILCPSVGDMCAYFGGMAFGKTPLAPKISPKKTVEGAAFSLLGSILAGLGLYYAQVIWAPEKGMGLFSLLSLGFI
ncbi:MAG: phosphatidate cytidylyltransferase, partial [Clostridia bacterium]|nr:phosphatidate cytidylyltransferase [Clostridia bacterium]